MPVADLGGAQGARAPPANRADVGTEEQLPPINAESKEGPNSSTCTLDTVDATVIAMYVDKSLSDNQKYEAIFESLYCSIVCNTCHSKHNVRCG